MTAEAEKALEAVNSRILSLRDEIRMVQESGCGGGDEYKADLVLFQEIRAALQAQQKPQVSVYGGATGCPTPEPELVTVKNISEYIESWRFDEDIEGAFGAYLMKLHPHGIKIVDGGE